MLGQCLSHVFIQLECPTEVVGQFTQIITLMDAYPSTLGWCHIHVHVQEQSLLLRLGKIRWLHLLQSSFVIDFTPLLLETLLTYLVLGSFGISHALYLLLEASWQRVVSTRCDLAGDRLVRQPRIDTPLALGAVAKNATSAVCS